MSLVEMPATGALENGFKPQGPKTFDTSTCMDKRSQPWKAHWPAKSAPCNGIQYGFEKGQKVIIYGS